MAKRGRKPGFTMSEDHRSKISKAMILNRLSKFIAGEVEMPPHAVTAALGLLRKVLPDLSSVEQTVRQVQPFAVLPSEIKDIAQWEQDKGETEH